MIQIHKTTLVFFSIVLISACNNKSKPIVEKNQTEKIIVDSITKNEETIEGFYETQPDPNSSGECGISIQIKKTKSGYTYFLKTRLRKLKGIATFTTSESGEKYLTLEGIKWDEYEGDISHEDETDSISDSESEHKELEIPVGIDARYVKDTLTIQNDGNAMNSYTKISECDRKYIQLIKK